MDNFTQIELRIAVANARMVCESIFNRLWSARTFDPSKHQRLT
jgi:hypothetical protein